VGAAVSLVGALVALSLLASSLLGVRLWPGGPGGGAGRLTLPAAPVHAIAATRARVHHAAIAAPAVRPAHTAAAHLRAVHHVVRRRAHRRAAPPAPGATATPAPPAASTPAPKPSTATAAAPAATATPSHGTNLPVVRTPVAPRHVVQQTVTTVRQTTQPVVNVLPPVVQTPVATVEDTLQQVATTVDQALAPVTGRLPPGH
jgi:hypothetical protein